MAIYYVKTETVEGKLYDTITIIRITKKRFEDRTHKVFIEDGLVRGKVCRAVTFAVCELFEYADKATKVQASSRLGWYVARNLKYRQAQNSAGLIC